MIAPNTAKCEERQLFQLLERYVDDLNYAVTQLLQTDVMQLKEQVVFHTHKKYDTSQ